MIAHNLVACWRGGYEVLGRKSAPDFVSIVRPAIRAAQEIYGSNVHLGVDNASEFRTRLSSLYPQIAPNGIWVEPPEGDLPVDLFDPKVPESVRNATDFILLTSLMVQNQEVKPESTLLDSSEELISFREWIRRAWQGRFEPGHPNIELDWAGTAQDVYEVLITLGEYLMKQAPRELSPSPTGEKQCGVTLADSSVIRRLCEMLHGKMVTNGRWGEDTDKYRVPFWELYTSHPFMVDNYMLILYAGLVAMTEV